MPSGKLTLVIAAWLGLAAPIRAQLDPELDKPYQLRVVLCVADNRFLTALFKEQLLGALRDHLQLRLAPVAKVEVVSAHARLPEIEANGLQSGLDRWEEISVWTTHFVLVDFSAGTYALQSRHYDGMTGLLSPAVRLATTNDRGLVAQTAARLVEQDFGLVGTVMNTGAEVELALKAGKLGAPLDQWVKPGEVFVISRITKEGERLRGTQVPWALLEAIAAPSDGICRCRLWHRFQEDDLRPRPGVLGYRCLKRPAARGRLKLRFIDDDDFRPLDGLQVHVLRADGTKAAEMITNRDGLLVSRDAFQHFALVRVLSGDSVRAQFPVDISDERTVVCRLKNQLDAQSLVPLELRRDQWLRRIIESLRLASERTLELNGLLATSTERALETARTGLKNMEAEVEDLTLERAQIALQAREKKAPLDMRDGEVGLATLGKKKTELERFITRLEEVQRASTIATTAGVAKQLERARLFEGEADFDQAMALYEKVLQISPEQTKVKEHLAKLKADWMPRNAKHAAARAFLVNTWPKLDVLELEKNLAQAHDALAVCRSVDDRLTPLRVIRADIVHAANLHKHLDALKRQDSVDNRTQAKAIAKVIDGVRRLHAEAAALAEKKGD